MDNDSLRIEKFIDLQQVNNSNLKGINKSLKVNNSLTETIIQNTEKFQSDQKEAIVDQNVQLKGLNTELKIVSSNIEKLSNNKLFGKIGYDTVFTVSVTLSIFVLGVIIDRIFKLIGNLKKQNKIKRYFCNNVKKFSDNLLTPMKGALREFYLQHDINTGIPLTAPRILTSEVARIADLDFKDIMESLLINLSEKIPSMVRMFLGSNVDQMLKDFFEKEGDSLFNDLIEKFKDIGLENLNIREIVIERINDLDFIEFEKIIFGLMNRELKHIEIIGLILGSLIGIVQYIITIFL